MSRTLDPPVQAFSTFASIRKPLDCGCPVGRLLPGLIYCDIHRPHFDPTDTRRHDRRRSNPEAVRLFGRLRAEA